MPAERVVHILRQMCHSLSEAESRSLVHRDIKPANVMLCERGGIHDVAKLLDYGLVVTSSMAQEEARLTRHGMVVGTPEFMSPEQCAGDNDVSGASDIYSLGAVAYYLLSGKGPFSGRPVMKMFIAHMSEHPRPLTEVRSDVPRELADVIARCLEKLPENRYSSVDALDHALTASMNGSVWTRGDARTWWSDKQARSTDRVLA